MFPRVQLSHDRPLDRISILYREVREGAERPANGSVVEVFSSHGEFRGRAFYNHHARVRLRLLTEQADEVVDDSFFLRRLEAATDLREAIGVKESGDCYRLVHSEGDRLPGLVIDRYNDLFVVEFFSLGMFRQRKLIRSFLEGRFPQCEIYTFSQRHIQKQESFDHYEDPIPAARVVTENGIRYKVHPGTKHKTGFFLDQRENRLRVSKLSSGRTLLDLCCHSGGFALSAKRAGAERVVGVDRDPLAIVGARENAGLNGLAAEWYAITLEEYFDSSKEEFDIVILDPPKQTRTGDGLPAARRRYIEWNRGALRRVKKGGTLVTCSCTGLLKNREFLDLIDEAFRLEKRKGRLVRWSGAGVDHPFSDKAPETHYLKVGWFELES